MFILFCAGMAAIATAPVSPRQSALTSPARLPETVLPGIVNISMSFMKCLWSILMFLRSFGVCCVIILSGTGSTSVSQNCTYIQNSGFPSALTSTNAISYTVNKCNDGNLFIHSSTGSIQWQALMKFPYRSDVCMLRLDFETFTMVGTNGSANDNEGDCLDTFVVTVSKTWLDKMPKNSNQLYISRLLLVLLCQPFVERILANTVGKF